MSADSIGAMSRRKFLKLSGAAASAAALAGPRVLHALVPATAKGTGPLVQEKFSACDMCFNKCGLIARVEDGQIFYGHDYHWWENAKKIPEYYD